MTGYCISCFKYDPIVSRCTLFHKVVKPSDTCREYWRNPSYVEPEIPATRRTDPETSHAAAQDVAPQASHGRMLVLQHLSKRPLTDYELADATGWQQNSIGKRRGECVERGWVQVVRDGNGEVVTRPAPSGSASRVWEITLLGRAAYGPD